MKKMKSFNKNLEIIFSAVFAAAAVFLFFANNAHAATNSNTFYSQVKDTGQASDFSAITWTDYAPDGTSVVVSVRAGNTATPDGTWTGWTAVTKGGSLNAIDGYRYVQYSAVFTYSNTSLTPNLQDITLYYYYYTGTYSLLSSPYNSTDPANALAKIAWSESNVNGTSTAVKFQVRTATNNDNGTPGDPSDDTPNTWFPAGGDFCGPDNGATGTCDEGTYFTDPTGLSEPVDDDMKGGTSDQWVQYKVYLSATSSWQSPGVQDATTSYVVNATPAVTNGTASENADGTISIGYDLADSDSSIFTIAVSADLGITVADNPLSSSATTINLSGNYSYLPTGSQTIIIENEQITCASRSGAVLSCVGGRGANNTTASSHVQTSIVWAKASVANATGNIGAGQTTGSGKSITWIIKSDFDGVYRNISQGKIRVTANDGNIANQVGNGDSAALVIDTKDPTNAGLTINHTTSQLTLTTPADDSSYQMLASNLPDFSDVSAQTFESPYAYNVSPQVLTTDPATVYLRIKDAYGNYTDASAITPAKPTNHVYYDTSNESTGEYREFTAWNVVSSQQVGSGFSSYKVYRKINGGSFALLATINDRLINYYLDKIKDNNPGTEDSDPDFDPDNPSHYYYKVITTDTSGNISDYSAVVDDIPNGQGGTDSTPPPPLPVSRFPTSTPLPPKSPGQPTNWLIPASAIPKIIHICRKGDWLPW